MLREDINKLMIEFGVKQEKIIETLDSNRVTFGKKMKDNSFSDIDRNNLYSKYRAIL